MCSKIHIEDVEAEFAERNYTLISKEYINQYQTLEFVCNIHKEQGIQTIKYGSFKYRHNGCHFCAKEKQFITQSLNVNELKRHAQYLNIDFKYVDRTSTSPRIAFICPVHINKGIQITKYKSFIKPTFKCKYCSGKVYDTETLINKMSKINPNIIILGQYKNSSTKIKCCCSIHNEIFYSQPRKLYEGNVGCKQCKSLKLKEANSIGTGTFINFMKEHFPMVEVVGEYEDSRIPIQLYCKEHNYYFSRRPHQYLHTTNPRCCDCGNSQLKSNEDFIKELKLINPHIVPLEKYRGLANKINCRCEKHNYEWKAIPSNILYQPSGCPKCRNYRGEIIISDLLNEWNIKYEMQKRFDDCVDKRSLPFDFFLSEHNIAIEYDGEGHFSPINFTTDHEKNIEAFNIGRKHDQIKNDYCKEKNIKLIRIPYWEKGNIENILSKEINIIR